MKITDIECFVLLVPESRANTQRWSGGYLFEGTGEATGDDCEA